MGTRLRTPSIKKPLPKKEAVVPTTADKPKQRRKSSTEAKSENRDS